jgi:hypothetical protein
MDMRAGAATGMGYSCVIDIGIGLYEKT